MTDHDRKSEHSTQPEEESPYQQNLSLILPKLEWQKDLQTVYNLSPQKEAKYRHFAEQFAASSRVIILAGMWGMGDSVMHVRFAINMAKQTEKQIVCQANGALIPFAEKLIQEVPNIQLVHKVPQEFVEDQEAFVLRFMGGGGRAQEVERWAEGDEASNAESIKVKAESGRVLELEDLTIKERGPDETFPEPFAPVQNKQGTFNTSYYFAGFVTQSLGVPVSPENIQDISIFTPSIEEVQQTPQDLDYVLIPDAKEFPDDSDYRSYKSLDLRMWEIILAQVPKDQKIGIVMGVSHPDYCQAVINIAEREGLTIEVLNGNLAELARQLLRAKKIVGMDSGTTHLSKDVQTAARKAGRTIDLKPLFNAELSHFEQYGIVETDSFTYTEENRSIAAAMTQFILN